MVLEKMNIFEFWFITPLTNFWKLVTIAPNAKILLGIEFACFIFLFIILHAGKMTLSACYRSFLSKKSNLQCFTPCSILPKMCTLLDFRAVYNKYMLMVILNNTCVTIINEIITEIMTYLHVRSIIEPKAWSWSAFYCYLWHFRHPLGRIKRYDTSQEMQSCKPLL